MSEDNTVNIKASMEELDALARNALASAVNHLVETFGPGVAHARHRAHKEEA